MRVLIPGQQKQKTLMLIVATLMSTLAPIAQKMANLSRVELSRAALSHAPLVSTGRPAWLLPDGPVTPDLNPMTDDGGTCST